MLQRNLLYTGVTRGKKLVVLVGQKKAVAIAVRCDLHGHHLSAALIRPTPFDSSGLLFDKARSPRPPCAPNAVRTKLGSARSFFYSSSRETMRSSLDDDGIIADFGLRYESKRLKDRARHVGPLLLDAVSRKPIYCGRSRSRAKRVTTSPQMFEISIAGRNCSGTLLGYRRHPPEHMPRNPCDRDNGV